MNGKRRAISALLDRYGQVVSDLKKIMGHIPDKDLFTVITPNPTDENYTTLQAILTPAVSCSYSYAVNICNLKGQNRLPPVKIFRSIIGEYKENLDAVLAI